ncbi:TraC family protein [Dickeya sp. NCPPB 3274]|uniref:TraC family protein n=1 Tax=Dickeya sp. NCPPB 3274 TaxID=568766 RepID=UPI0003A4C71F|nr:TraC family protein [Dickeya sp. NCPPB 3274]
MITSITNLAEKLLLRGQLTSDKVLNMSDRESLSTYLPYLSYAEETKTETGESVKSKTFLNIDNTLGWIWEFTPPAFIGNDQLNKMHNIIKSRFPRGTVAQWILFPDHNVEPFLNDYAACRNLGDPINRANVNNMAAFLRDAAENGISPKMSGIPVRNFRCFYTLKCEEIISEDILSSLEQIFYTAGMNPRRWCANDLLQWLKPFLTGTEFIGEYDPERPIAQQVMTNTPAYERSWGGNHQSQFDFDITPNVLSYRYGTCLFPNTVPKKGNNPLRTNQLFGGYKGGLDDAGQIKHPFLYTLTIIYDDLKTEIANKASQTMFQRVGAGLAFRLAERIKEFSSMQRVLATNGNFAYYIPQLWIFGKTPKDVRAGVSEAQGLWKDHEFELMPETVLSKIMFLTALPFGFYNIGKNLTKLNRFFYADYENLARFLPVQGDFRGGGRPVQTYIGRKGQLIGMDMFDPRVNSHNFYVIAETGGGKSFSLNDLLDSYASCGAKVRITDLGASYQKLTSIRKGKYIEFSLHNPICMNPLDFHSPDKEDFEMNISAAVIVYSAAAYSFTGNSISELEANLLDQACHYAHQVGDQLRGTDAVIEYLRLNRWAIGTDIGAKTREEIELTAHRLAFLLNNFSSAGQFKDFFVGKSEFNISDEDFVCTDLEKLKSQKQLFFPMIMQVMNSVTQDLYLSDRSTPRFILFEEVASMVKKQGNISMDGFSSMAEEGYRRARKYRGSFGIVLQSPLDFELLPGLGQVAQGNAPFKYYLESPMYGEAATKGLLPGIKPDTFPLELLSTVKNHRPNYGEIFIDSPLGMGVARLCVDKWRYWINTSDGKDVAAYNRLVESGVEPVDALRQLSGVDF